MAKIELTARDIYQGGSNITIMREIPKRHQHAKIQVGGKSTAIDAQTANVLVMVHDALDAKNKVSFAAMTAHSVGTFRRMVDFAWKQAR